MSLSNCPECATALEPGAVICSACDFILDTSFLGRDITDDSSSGPPVDEDSYASMFAEQTGGFLTSPTAEMSRLVFPLGVNETADVRKLLEDDAVPQQTGNLAPGALSDLERRVLAEVNSERPVARIRSIVELSPHDVRVALSLLADKGLVTQLGVARSAQPAELEGVPHTDVGEFDDPTANVAAIDIDIEAAGASADVAGLTPDAEAGGESFDAMLDALEAPSPGGDAPPEWLDGPTNLDLRGVGLDEDDLDSSSEGSSDEESPPPPSLAADSAPVAESIVIDSASLGVVVSADAPETMILEASAGLELVEPTGEMTLDHLSNAMTGEPAGPDSGHEENADVEDDPFGNVADEDDADEDNAFAGDAFAGDAFAGDAFAGDAFAGVESQRDVSRNDASHDDAAKEDGSEALDGGSSPSIEIDPALVQSLHADLHADLHDEVIAADVDSGFDSSEDKTRGDVESLAAIQSEVFAHNEIASDVTGEVSNPLHAESSSSRPTDAESEADVPVDTGGEVIAKESDDSPESQAARAYDLAMLDLQAKRFTRARSFLRVAHRLAPNAGLYAAFLDNWDRVKERAESPGTPPLPDEMRLFLDAQERDAANDPLGAVELLEQAIQISPANPQLHNFLGVIFAGRLHDPERALKPIMRAVELEPAQVDFRRNLQRVLSMSSPVPDANKDEDDQEWSGLTKRLS